MPVLRIVSLLLLAGLVLGAASAPAAEIRPRSCLNKDEQRAALAAGRAIPLAQAKAAISSRGRRDVIHARLCEGPNGLVYLLTLLPRSGKVTRVTVDAATGAVIRGH